jgi:oligopeptide/dipeptide ABC transporter ATP-binding protein
VISKIADRVLVMYAGRAAEQGPVRATFDAPAHPYTSALLASAPTLQSDRDRPLKTIEGALPLMTDRRPGCVFAPRCEFARQECTVREPALLPIAGGEHREVACFFPLVAAPAGSRA